MVTFDLKHVQTLHTLSQLPISVMSQDKELIQLYGNKDYLLPYHQFLKRLTISCEENDICCYEGLFEESFLIFAIRQQIIAIGPFYPYALDLDYHNKLADDFLRRFSERSKEDILAYLALVPCFPLVNMRSLFVALDAFFHTQFEDKHRQIIKQLLKQSERIVSDPEVIRHLHHDNRPSFQLPTVLDHLNQIISLVKLGNPQLLKQEINRIPLSSITSSSISALRAEKNLSVIYFTKLLELSFVENTDVPKHYRLVKRYITLNEEASNLIEVLQIRYAAILSFSESLTNKSISDNVKCTAASSIMWIIISILSSKSLISPIICTYQNPIFVLFLKSTRRFRYKVISSGLRFKKHNSFCKEECLLAKSQKSSISTTPPIS